MRRIAIPALVLLASLLVALLLSEAVLRLVGFSAPMWYRPDPVLGWTLRPHVKAMYTREGSALVHVNSAGQRDQEHVLDKPAGVYRIAVLGDSYSEAMQVERRQAYWAQLPERLSSCGFQQGKKIEVLNFGVAGYGTAQEYIMLESQAMRYRPDLVLLQFTNGNDVRNNSFSLEEEKDRPFFLMAPDGTLRINDSFASSPGFRKRSSFAWETMRRVSDRSRVFQLVRSVKDLQLIPAASANAGGGVEQGLEAVVLAPPRDALWQEAWQITEGLLAMTRDHARRNGAEFVVVTVPYAIQVHPDRKVRESLQAKLGVPDLFYPDQRIAEFAKKAGFQAVTLAPAMQKLAEGSGTYFHGFDNIGMGRGHWNVQGHATAAELIARQLCAATQ